jgi:hypothetical protein
MKRTLLLLLAASAMIAGGNATAMNAKDKACTYEIADWKKAENGTWPGKDGVWYKLDDKANLWWSKDGKKWEQSKDGTWQDKEGKWLKIGDQKLWWSADGKKWSEVPEWKWEAADGHWYKFDKDWSVWTNKK